jgi:enoyl-CoA hydratase/carnithine racemase
VNDVVRYEVIDGAAWLTIDRPEARNALSRDVRDGLWGGFRAFNEDTSAGVLILTGTGDTSFCAGGDLKEMAESSMAVPPADFLPLPGRNIDVPKPTIAAVNGAALAGGFALAQYCDLCIAVETARFAITEARVGRGAPWATPLPWLIPPRVALELLVTAESIDARRALELGLVNKVVPVGELHGAASSMARAILANAPLSVLASKRTVYLAARGMLAGVQDEADAIWRPVYASDDAQEGPRAFRDKRAPHWEGR